MTITKRTKGHKNFWAAILLAGTVAGILDATAASIQFFIQRHKSPAIVWKYVASAVRGPVAMSGGTKTVILGLLLHFAVAFSFTLFFFSIYPKLKLNRANILLVALVYGLFVWAVMNLVVVPMTKIGYHTPKLQPSIIGALILIFCIGLPISLIAKRYYQLNR